MEDLNKEGKQLILKGIQSLKSEACLQEAQLGTYLENRLSPDEQNRIQNHLDKCLYCVNLLTEIRELIFLENSSQPLTLVQTKQFSQFLNKKPHVSYLERLWKPIFCPTLTWKFAAGLGLMIILSLTSMVVTIKIKSPAIFAPRKEPLLTETAQKNIKQGGVKIDLLSPTGENIQTIPGVVIDSNGLVLTSLKDLKKADSARVKLSDGSSLPVVGVQADNERNLAILKISQTNLVPVKITRPKSLKVGDQFIHIIDPTDPESSASHVTITQVIDPARNVKRNHQTVEVLSQHPIDPKGILVNSLGETVGKIVEGGGMTGSAITFDFNETFAPSENFIPISLIGK